MLFKPSQLKYTLGLKFWALSDARSTILSYHNSRFGWICSLAELTRHTRNMNFRNKGELLRPLRHIVSIQP